MSAGSSLESPRVSAGARLRAALEAERPLQVVGTINAYAALLAQRAGFRAIYLSGAGVANASSGCRTWASPRSTTCARTCGASAAPCELPLLVDADTGWGGAFNIARTVKDLHPLGRRRPAPRGPGAAKRCGHRPGKELVPRRGDGRSPQGRGRCAARDAELRDHGAHRCARGRGPGGGARARRGLRRGGRRHDLRRGDDAPCDEYQRVHRTRSACRCSPTSPSSARRRCSRRAAGRRGRAARALSAVRLPRRRPRRRRQVYGAIRRDGTQKSVLALMQTRAELYEVLGYHAYERKLDELFGKEPS